MKMKALVTLLLLAAAVNGARKGGLRATWGYGTNIGTDFFFDLPKSIKEVKTQGWDAVEKPAGLHYPSLDMYCSDDRILCCFFDDTNYVAGIQIAIPLDDVENVAFDWTIQGYKYWETKVDGVTKRFYAIQQYFVSEESLAKNVAERLRSWKIDQTIQEDAIWAASINGTLLKIPTVTQEIANSDFTEQGCMFWMGSHYLYKTDKTTECRGDTFAPWFAVVDSGDLVATGYSGFYAFKKSYKWFEIPTRPVALNNFPNAPNCLYEMTDSPGAVTLHIFYIDEPWLLSCPTQ